MLPRKQDVADGRPVAVDTQKAESEGDLGHPGASSLDQQVDEKQAESSQQGEDRPVFRTGEGQQTDKKGSLNLKFELKFLIKNIHRAEYLVFSSLKEEKKFDNLTNHQQKQ